MDIIGHPAAEKGEDVEVEEGVDREVEILGPRRVPLPAATGDLGSRGVFRAGVVEVGGVGHHGRENDQGDEIDEEIVE